MNLDKLNKQLRRDMAANPKKAALLGLMVLVALYFWGPLVWKFVAAKQSKQRSAADMASLILTDDPVEAVQPGKSRGVTKFRWDKVRQLIRQDSRMFSAKFDSAWIDPFGKADTDKREVVAEALPDDSAVAAASAAAAQVIDPKDLGIVLGAIMIGPRTRVATINGESCREGDIVTITAKGDATSTFEFRVHRIAKQSVQLAANGRIFALELTPPKLGNGDKFKTAQSR